MNAAANEVTISWNSAAGRVYQLHQSEDLSTWRPVPGIITATPATNQEAVATPPGARQFFLKVEASVAP